MTLQTRWKSADSAPSRHSGVQLGIDFSKTSFLFISVLILFLERVFPPNAHHPLKISGALCSADEQSEKTSGMIEGISATMQNESKLK
ncbi:MAG TPA: hypothetical protein VMH87_12505 [Pseudomonadales bacterium]|nr:hypothetical protein [Pseudomonadales bacterium]